MQIVGLIHREGQAFGISFPDLPGCISAGSTLDDVIHQGMEALDFHISAMIDDGEPLREFRTVDSLRDCGDFDEEFKTAELVTLLATEIPGKAVKVTITMEEHLLQRLNTAAERQGYTRSGFIADAVRRRLRV